MSRLPIPHFINQIKTKLGFDRTLTASGEDVVDAVNKQSQQIGDLTDLETTVKTDLVSAVNETVSDIQLIENTVYQGNVITNTVPANQATTVRSFTLTPGTYLIIGCVIYKQSFQNFASTSLIVNGSGRGTVRGTGVDGGEGIPIVNVITLNADTLVELKTLQLSTVDRPIDTATTFFKAVKLI